MKLFHRLFCWAFIDEACGKLKLRTKVIRFIHGCVVFLLFLVLSSCSYISLDREQTGPLSNPKIVTKVKYTTLFTSVDGIDFDKTKNAFKAKIGNMKPTVSLDDICTQFPGVEGC